MSYHRSSSPPVYGLGASASFSLSAGGLPKTSDGNTVYVDTGPAWINGVPPQPVTGLCDKLGGVKSWTWNATSKTWRLVCANGKQFQTNVNGVDTGVVVIGTGISTGQTGRPPIIISAKPAASKITIPQGILNLFPATATRQDTTPVAPVAVAAPVEEGLPWGYIAGGVVVVGALAYFATKGR